MLWQFLCYFFPQTDAVQEHNRSDILFRLCTVMNKISRKKKNQIKE